jgi:hypothetical protein
MAGRFFLIALVVALVALGLRVLQLGASIALLWIAGVAGLIALVLGLVTLAQRRMQDR